MTKTRVRSGETVVFAVATAVALLHALDDAFTGREPGVGFGQHALVAGVALIAGLGAISAFPHARPAARSALAFFLGSLAVVNGAQHVPHFDGAGDATGVLAAAAGLVLVGLAAVIPWRHRGYGSAGRARRWTCRVLAVPAGLLATLFVILPIGVGITETHKYREHVGPAPAGYREVAFDASDGVRLAGWYRPTRNGATVIVLHGGGGDRTGALSHAQVLARHGYGVLLYDARGRGRSEGAQNAFGWGWNRDLAGALAFLKSRPEVDAGRIGGLGLSTGADVLVSATGRRNDLRAVVGDGAAAESFEDWRRLQGITAMTPMFALEFATVRLTSGTAPDPPLADMIRRGHAPLLLISAGRREEYDFNAYYARLPRGVPLEHWNLPRAAHTAALGRYPSEYERRVTAFFDANLT